MTLSWYSYEFQDVRTTNLHGIRELISDFLSRCKEPELDRVSFSLEKGAEEVSYNDPSGFLSSRLLPNCSNYNIELSAKSRESLNIRGWGVLNQVMFKVRYFPEDVALTLVKAVESHLAIQPLPKEPVPSRSAFVAYSFDEAGKLVADVVINLLRLLGFQVTTGEPYVPRGASSGVSDKVKKRIIQQGVAVCILTDEGDGRASDWVVSEAVAADTLEKPLILIVQDGVQLGTGIFGDIEEIPLKFDGLHEVIIKLIQGLKELGFSFSD